MSEKNSPVRAPLLPYTAVADLIVQLMGKGCEVVLHDLDTPQHSVVYVAGESVTGRKPGQGFRHLVSELIRTPRETPNITPNWFFEHEGKPVRSTTLFIRNSRGELTGALCVNLDVTGAVRDFERLASLLPGLAGINPLSESPAAPLTGTASVTAETGSGNAENVFTSVCRLIDRMTAAGAKTREERLQLIDFMQDRGVFLVKGALEYAADKLGISKVTVYSDLDALKRRKTEQQN